MCLCGGDDNNTDSAVFACNDEAPDDKANEKLRNLYADRLEWPSYCCCADLHRMQRVETIVSQMMMQMLEQRLGLLDQFIRRA
jgi:hypothetical protein